MHMPNQHGDEISVPGNLKVSIPGNLKVSGYLVRLTVAALVAGGLQASGLAGQAPGQPPAGQQPAPAQPQQPSAIELVITGDPGTPPRYAVPDFVGLTPDAAEIGRTLGQVLWDDLDYEREFYLLPRDTYRTVPVARTPEQVPFAAWRELGADAIVFGSVERKGEDVRVQVRLFNVRSQLQVFSKEYTGSARNPRFFAHTIADEIHDAQRNVRGVARTKLAFSSDRKI